MGTKNNSHDLDESASIDERISLLDIELEEVENIAPPPKPPRTTPPPPPTRTPKPPSIAPPRVAPKDNPAHLPTAPLPPSSGWEPVAVVSVHALRTVPIPLEEKKVPATTLKETSLSLRSELRRRIERLRPKDPLGAARTSLELGLLEFYAGDGVKAAKTCFEQACSLVPGQPAFLEQRRRLLEGRAELLSALDEELKSTTSDTRRADLLTDRARLCAEMNRAHDVRTAFRDALRLVPQHGAALRGLLTALEDEVSSSGNKNTAVELETHLALLASLYHPENADGDPRLAAWLLVERAALLDTKLGQPEQALASLRRAVSLQPLPGAVRDALSRFLISHKYEQGYCETLVEEAEFETDEERSSRLLYIAARVRCERLRQPSESIPLLKMALLRSSSNRALRRKILQELRRLYEEAGQLPDAINVQSELIEFAEDSRAKASEHTHLFELLHTHGRKEDAIQQARLAASLCPEDTTLRAKLDDALAAREEHRERVELWTQISLGSYPLELRLQALLKAADIEKSRGRSAEAISLLRTAWSLSPGDPTTFDALSALLVPPPRDASDARGVRERLELYQEAVRTTTDLQRKIALHEKIASIWEDELFHPARAVDEFSKILALEPQRRTAILALQRNAVRAGNDSALVKALCLEVNATTDPNLQRRLLLRAVEITRDRLEDIAAASSLLTQAEALDPSHPEVLRARATHARLTARFDDARKALLALLSKTPKPEAFSLWIEIASLDEYLRKNLRDAVASYRQAARISPEHPDPPREIQRLLYRLGDLKTLADVFLEMASVCRLPDQQMRLLLDAAELQEIALNDDDAALRSLQRTLTLSCPLDPACNEAMERIFLRKSNVGLADLYRRWLAESLSLPTRQRLRIALALLLQDTQRTEAIQVLQQALSESRDLLPALRLLRALQRRSKMVPPQIPTLQAEADTCRSGLARHGTLWEIASLEEHLGEANTLTILEKILHESPDDSSALDGILRISSVIQARGESAPAATRQALQGRRKLLSNSYEIVSFFLTEALLLESSAPEETRSEALSCYRSALSLYPESLLAAFRLSRLASEVTDQEAMVLAETSLGSLVEDPIEQARHLVLAANLLRGQYKQQPAIDLYEQALAKDPDNHSAASSLVTLLTQDPARLIRALTLALDHARDSAQILSLGSDIGRTILANLSSELQPSVGISAVLRALTQAPESSSLLMMLARLRMAARLWPEARESLLRILSTTGEQEALIAAYFELISLYRGPLKDNEKALASLRALLALDNTNLHALEELRRLGADTGNLPLVIEALSSLAANSPEPENRVKYDLLLAEIQQSTGNIQGQVHALCDAILVAGPDPHPWDTLARLFRTTTKEGASNYADALTMLLRIAEERRIAILPYWLSTLGMLEATVLLRYEDALQHLHQAVALPGATSEEIALLGQGLEISDHNTEAIRTLRHLLAEGDGLTSLNNPGIVLTSLEAALAKEGRTEELLPIQEIRACLGGMPDDWMNALRARRIPASFLVPNSITGPELQRLLLPTARSPMMQVAQIVSPIAAKALGFSLSALGLSSRERISPRDGHPTRILAERIARTLGVESFELYLAAAWTSPPRAYPGDPPALVLPSTFADFHELEQATILGRLLFRVTVGLPFLDEFSPELIDGFLISALHATDPTILSMISGAREQTAQPYLVPMQKAIGRRQRKQIEEVIPSIPTNFEAHSFISALRRSELRIAYLLTGSLLSCIDTLRRTGEVTEPLLHQPVLLELFRYVMTESAIVDRWRIGSTWTERRGG